MVQARNALSLCSYFLPTGIPSFNLDFASLRRFSRTERTSLRYSFEIFSGFLNRPEAPQSEDRKPFPVGHFRNRGLVPVDNRLPFLFRPFGRPSTFRTNDLPAYGVSGPYSLKKGFCRANAGVNVPFGFPENVEPSVPDERFLGWHFLRSV